MAGLADLLKEDAPAEIEFQLGDQTTKLSISELRNLAAERDSAKAAAAQHEQMANATAQRLAQLEQSQATLLANAARSVEADQNRPDAVQIVLDRVRTALNPDQGYDFSKDKYLSPALEKARQDADALANAKVGQLLEGLKPVFAAQAASSNTALQVAVEEKERAIFNAFPDRPTDKTLEDVRHYAMHNRILDQRGWPDIRAALESMTVPARQAKHDQEIYQKAISDMKKEYGMNMPFVASQRGVEMRELKPLVEFRKPNG